MVALGLRDVQGVPYSQQDLLQMDNMLTPYDTVPSPPFAMDVSMGFFNPIYIITTDYTLFVYL